MASRTWVTGSMIAAVVVAMGAVLCNGPANALDITSQIKLGEGEYIGNCAACHGGGGRGDGPVADVLSIKPNDLTAISKRYNDTFPADHIYAVIDGSKMINPHGDRDMPVWGPRYWALASERAGSVPHDVDTQALVHGRISALVTYLESIQAD